MNQPIRGVKYRLETGKGYGEAKWWVLSKDGRTEVAGGLMYDQAKQIFDSCEAAITTPTNIHATLNPTIIDFEEESRAEMRHRGRKMRWIPPKQ